MAFDRQGAGLTIARIVLGVFFIAEGLGRFRWLGNSSMLRAQLGSWLHTAAAGSMSRWYLARAMPFAGVLARIVPLAQLGIGLALLVGFWTPLFALLAFLMVLNADVASGALFEWSRLSHGDPVLVLGSTLALAVGGVRLPWSIR